MSDIPKWAAEAVWYQIFPDRFCRFNSSSPITPADIEGTSPWNLHSSNPWQVHPWTSDWYERQPYERQNGKPLKDNILRRRYCGDIKGIASRLGYLRDLGVNALYINPMQYSPSLHKYDGTDFLHIDPFLGSNPLADKAMIEASNFSDFQNAPWTEADMEALDLIEEAHRMGMRVIFDGVFNHIGYNSVPFRDVMEKGEKSEYFGWFIASRRPGGRLKYERFWGTVREMPKLNYGCPSVRRYVMAALKRWLKPVAGGFAREGIDGWRLDHAIGVPPTFWMAARKMVKETKPDALFLAELIEPGSVIKPYLDDGIFDSVMNYGLYFLVCEFFAGERSPISASEFSKKIARQLQLFPVASNYMMMNLVGSHDTERAASLVVNRGLKEFGSIGAFFKNTAVGSKGYTSRRPGPLERRIQQMMVAFEFAAIGAPMIYYGDELGMWGAGDPCCRKPMMWPEMEFCPETIVNGGRRTRGICPVKADMEMLDFYKRIVRLRRSCAALSSGTMATDFAHESRRVLIISRALGGTRAIFAFNREDEPCRAQIPARPSAVFQDYMSGGQAVASKSGTLAIGMEPMSFRILIENSTSDNKA